MISRRSFLLGTTTMVAAASTPSPAPAVTCTVDPALPAPTYEQIASVLQDVQYEQFCQALLQRITSAYGLPYEALTVGYDFGAEPAFPVGGIPPMTTAIICGGRSYGIVPKNCPPDNYTRMQQLALGERHRLSVILREARERLAVSKMVMGDQTGADHLAAEWCKGNGMPFQVYEADWTLPNYSGGPIRNLKMIRAELPPPTICIAFPGAKGTKNMCKQAQENFLRVIPIDWRWPS